MYGRLSIIDWREVFSPLNKQALLVYIENKDVFINL